MVSPEPEKRIHLSKPCKRRKRERKIVQVYYLDEFVDMTTHNLVGGHAGKDLELFGGKGILCPHHSKASIVPDIRQP